MAGGRGDAKANGGAPTVFISYASQDAGIADAIVAALEHAGLSCWIAPRNVVPGSLYADEIVAAINDARVVVLVLSEHAIASPHVGKEVERASSKRRRIIVVRTDTAPLTRALEYFLSESQWIGMEAGGSDAAAAKLVEAVGRHIDLPAETAPLLAQDKAVAHRAAAIPRATWILLAGIAAISITLVPFIGKIWTSEHLPPTPQVPAATPPANDKSVAVLPFVDMSESRDQEYFADGMAEEVLDLLAKVPGIRVIGRTSSFQFKGKNDDLRRIGNALGAAFIVQGSVRKSGDRLRVTAQLIGAQDGSHLWSETYDEGAGDVLQVQDRIAAGLVRALQVTIGADDLQSRRPLKRADAYDLYLRGRHSYDRFDNSGFNSAASYFQQALDIDPTSVRAAEWLALTYESEAEWGFAPPRDGFERARVATSRALTLDPRSSRAHSVMCAIATIYDWDWERAGIECRLSLSIEPRNPYALATYDQMLVAVGQFDAAERAITDSLSIDPMDASSHVLLGSLRRHRGALGDAEAEYRRALAISPRYESGHWYLGVTLLAQGKVEAALAEMQQEAAPMARNAGLAIVYHAMKRDDLSDAAIARMTEDWSYEIADAYAYRGDRVHALQWLEHAYELKDPSLAFIKADVMFADLAREPRYRALLRKMRLAE